MVLPPSLPPIAGRPLRILVVDDDPVLIALAEAWLSKHGNVVGVARDGVEAMDALSTQRFDLILLDLEMPVMDGFDVLSELRADARHLDVPVVVVTSRSDTAAIDEAYRRGATSFVVKPLVWDLVVRHIRYVFNAERLKRGFDALEEALADAASTVQANR
jgi:CheY-like chemotaxis protein